MTRRFVPVVICTKDTATGVALAARSILTSEHSNLDVIVVNQSDGLETKNTARSPTNNDDGSVTSNHIPTANIFT